MKPIYTSDIYMCIAPKAHLTTVAAPFVHVEYALHLQQRLALLRAEVVIV